MTLSKSANQQFRRVAEREFDRAKDGLKSRRSPWLLQMINASLPLGRLALMQKLQLGSRVISYRQLYAARPSALSSLQKVSFCPRQ
jgi:hypothetical protein